MEAFSWNAILNFGIPIAFYYEGSQAPGRHLTGLLTHQGGTTDRWYSMKIPLLSLILIYGVTK